MIDVSESVTWLLQAAATLPDTIVTKQVATERGWFEKVTGIASGIMTIALTALAVFLIPAAWNFRKSYAKISDLLDRVYGDINPIMRHASTIADNVNYLTTAIRVDVQQVSQTIAEANQKLREATVVTERRLQEFNALLKVVQQEAEDVFVASASTAYGVRAGAAAFGEELDAERSRRVVLDGTLEPDLEIVIDDEVIDGNDDDDDETTAIRRPGPRIRPRGPGFA